MALSALAPAGACSPSASPNPGLLTLPQLQQRIDPQASNRPARARAVLLELALRNRRLAQELGRLPELHDGGTTDQEVRALERIAYFQQHHPVRVARALERLCPRHQAPGRRFCAPLREIFHRALERELDAGKGDFPLPPGG